MGFYVIPQAITDPPCPAEHPPPAGHQWVTKSDLLKWPTLW